MKIQLKLFELKRNKIFIVLGVLFAFASTLLFPYITFSQGNGLYEFIGRNGKYGFMDKTGEVVIPAKYIYVNKFSEELAFVAETQDPLGYYSWVCIDTDRKSVV